MKKIPLHGEYGKGKFTLIDDEDFELVSPYRWHTDGRYARTKHRGKLILIHRLLIAKDKGRNIHVDHINGDSLDNRRQNLRLCTTSQNAMNRGITILSTSGYKGVTWKKRWKHWTAQIKANKKYLHLGTFDNKEDAAKAYNEGARKHHGEFARLNKVEGQND